MATYIHLVRINITNVVVSSALIPLIFMSLPENEGTIINVCAGYNHTVLHSDTGKTFAFGDNTMGQLGYLDMHVILL